MTHTIRIVDIQKVPNLAAPQAGIQQSIVYYQLDGNADLTFSLTIELYPLTLEKAKTEIDADVKMRDHVVGQVFQVN